MKVMNGLVMTREKTGDFYVFGCSVCEQFCRFANGGAKISIKSCFMRSFFVAVVVYSVAVKC